MAENDIIIIGAGPAGIAAAIQLKRSRLNPIVFEKKNIGGLLNNANLVENYPGFPGGITGPALVRLFKEHIESFGIDIIYEQVQLLDYDNELFTATTKSNKTESKAVIIASGTKPRLSNKIKISSKIKNRIYYEVTDLLELEEKNITIIGAGDAAFDYALNLARKNSITILNRSDNIKCLPLLFDRVKNNNSIKYRSQIKVSEIIETANNQLLLECRNDSKDIDIISDYVILAFGREVPLDFMTENLLNQKDDLERKDQLYFVGDVNGRLYRQTAIAVGEGVLAAMKIAGKIWNK